MVYIFTATMKEAKPLIKRYSLKKLDRERAFLVYADIDDNKFYKHQSYLRPYPKSIELIVTGVGQFNAAAAAGLLLTDRRLHIRNYVINIGIAAGNSKTEINETYLINKIYSKEQDKYYFPRNYLTTEFKEAGLISGITPVKNFSKINEDETLLFDMEAAGIMDAISHIYSPERILFLKTVSDHGTDELAKSSKEIENVINNFPNERIINFIDFLRKKSEDETGEAEDLDYDNDEADLFTYLEINGEKYRFNYNEELCCSMTMLHELSKLQKFSWQEETYIEKKLSELIEDKRLPKKTKRESLKIIAEIKDYILSSL